VRIIDVLPFAAHALRLDAFVKALVVSGLCLEDEKRRATFGGEGVMP
jgi:hypothetical protein